MAAACSITDFEQSINGLTQIKKNLPNIYNLCLNPVAETVESNAFEFAPRGSLLIWIDNFMSLPSVTSDKRLGVWENILQSTHLIPKSLRSLTTIKCFKAGKYTVDPQKHGDFSNEKFWLQSFWEI